MYNKNLFSDSKGSNSFQRVDETHLLDIYLGIDDNSRNTLFLISDQEPPEMQSSQIINVSVGKRQDDRWGISFALVDNKFEDIFVHFCNDIIESSRSLTDKDRGADYISGRFTKWQNMLTKLNGDILPLSAIKGLVGELSFLKDYLIPKYGQEVAINSWIGPEKADQDFVCEDIWYEVKSAVSGAETVNISSVEQLDMPLAGELVIIYLDKTSQSDSLKITLNGIFKEVCDSLDTDALKNKLSGLLLNLGYYSRPEYDKPAFKYSKTERYFVDSKFPCMRRSDLSRAIVNSKYVLSLLSISNYLREQ